MVRDRRYAPIALTIEVVCSDPGVKDGEVVDADIGEIRIPVEVVRVMLLGVAGFTLTDEERALVRPHYIRLLEVIS